MTRRQLVISRILSAAYIITVAILCFGKFSASEEVPMDLWGIPTDKIVHFLMFFPLPVLAYLAFDRYRGKRRPALFWTVVAFLGGCAFAAFTEWIQTMLPYRTGDPADFKADVLALVASSVVILAIILLKHKK